MSGLAPAIRGQRQTHPPMPDRLDELRKQRALVQQHLTWLDHEIASVTVTRLTLPPFAMRGNTRPPVPGVGGTNPATPRSGTTRSPLTGAAIPELADFQVDPDNVHGDTRRGCIIYSAIAFLVLVAICIVIYFVGYRDRPLLIVPTKSDQMVYPAAPPKAPAAPAQKPATPPPAKP